MIDEVVLIESPAETLLINTQTVEIVELAPNAVEIVEIAIQGERGESGAGTTIADAVSFGDVTQRKIGTVAANKLVLEVLAVVTAPFNGVGAGFSVGTLADHDALLPLGLVSAGAVGNYGFEPCVQFGAITDIYVFLTAGAAPTTGNAKLLISTES